MSSVKAFFEVLLGIPDAVLPNKGLLSLRTLIILNIIFLFAIAFLIIKKLAATARKDRNESQQSNAIAQQAKIEDLSKQLEEINASNNQRNNYISSLFSAMDNGVILFERDKSIILFNDSAKCLASINSRCFFYPFELEHNPVIKAVFEKFDEVMTTCKAVTFKLKNHDNRDLEIGISPVSSKYRDRTLLGVLVILKDVTEREKIERIRKDFISNVSHEFRTPLTLISGFIETLKMWENLPAPDRNRSLEILEIETGRLSKLISELLLLSEIEHRIDNGTNTPIDIASSIDQAVASLAPLAAANQQKIEKNINISFPLLYGNESWFYQAFKNILENAIKYTPKQGHIEIDARAADDRITISVRDTGIGIPETELEKIFERFYRVEKARSSRTGGSGIGLAIVKDIMSLFGGHVEVQSSIGHGSIFTLVFPICKEPMLQQETKASVLPK